MCSAYLVGWKVGDRFGEPVLGVAWGYALAMLLVVAVPYTIYCLKLVDGPLRDVFAAMRRPAVAAIVMGAVVWLTGRWITTTSLPTRLAVLLALGPIVYILVAREEIAWMIRHVRQMFAAKLEA
jgi:hypothetical protein